MRNTINDAVAVTFKASWSRPSVNAADCRPEKITSSNIEEIEAGVKVIYAEAEGGGTLDTDVVLDAGQGNSAEGHVVLDLGANKGTVTFSGGTGKFVGFEADVTADSDGLWHWEATYSVQLSGGLLHSPS